MSSFWTFYGNLWSMDKKSGELNGILVSKGKAWVEVKEDELSVSRYLAPWIGNHHLGEEGLILNCLVQLIN